MAALVSMISVVVPIRKIDDRYTPGGFSGYLRDRGDSRFRWHDEHLLVSVHPDPEFVEFDLQSWEDRGLTAVESGRWIDICVVDQSGGPTLPCDWIEFDRKDSCVWLKGHERGEVIGPDDPGVVEGVVKLDRKILDRAEVSIVPAKPWWKFWGN